MDITLPYNFTPRPYQIPVLQALDKGIKKGVCVWHRRSGKDLTLFNAMVKKSQERIGVYFYLFPTYNQGRKALWNNITKDQKKFLSYVPDEIIKSQNDHEMMIELKNGSIIQVIGTDRVDSIVGTNPVGCVFSEYALQNPRAWSLLSPILAENGGWAVFDYTPRGKNHGYNLFQYASGKDSWFCQKLTVDDTGCISEDILEEEKERLMMENNGDDSIFQQEYYCSFDVAIQGSYYGKLMLEAEEQGRIGNIPWQKSLPVDTWWDLGMNNMTVIWFSQTVGEEIRFIDYYEASGEGLPHYAEYLRQKPYEYGNHVSPWDIKKRELNTGTSRFDTARKLGISFRVNPQSSVADGIEAVRNTLKNCWFDKTKCEKGLNALHSYTKEYDDERACYKPTPKHDWASDAADAFRTFAVGYPLWGRRKIKPKKPIKYSKTNTVSGY